MLLRYIAWPMVISLLLGTPRSRGKIASCPVLVDCRE
jgi:hypothetical protein